ncbi:globin-like [Dermacentor albipictus]|uniref:globin-like n=1 Tax=Dermacentor albipictus TaxID=60249 RepID=UPI0031FDD845
MLLFMCMFTKHPDYLKLFKQFRGRDLRSLPTDPKFRAHASAVGHQLSAMIECLHDPDVLIVLIQKNALSHATRNVKPANFEGLFEAVIEEMAASEKSLMKTAPVTAWEKLFDVRNEASVLMQKKDGAETVENTVNVSILRQAKVIG